MTRLTRAFYRRDARVVAPDLLNKVLVRGKRRARIVEVEAYCGADDPGSHAYRGQTARNATMFGAPGHLYVYFTYGMHHCANVVCGEVGEGAAVLLRGLDPVAGQDEMRAARPVGSPERDLCRGPARLCQAFGIDKPFDGADLVSGDRGIVIADDGAPPPVDHGVSGRIGLSVGGDRPWRFFVRGARGLSRPG